MADSNVHPGEGGLPRLVLTSADGGRAEVYLHGAHVARWTTGDGDDVLYLSPRSRFEAGQAIRGGIPVVFPQFATRGPLPKHGFARTAEWALIDASSDTATLELVDTPETRAVWDFSFHARLRMEIGDGLRMSLSIRNTDVRPFDFTCALHTYDRVPDITRTEVVGLEGVKYIDSVTGESHVQSGDRLDFRGETDRIYLDAPEMLRIRDLDGGRTITIAKHGFPDAVVWNPWAEKSAALDDLGEGEHARFVCVEAGCIGRPVHLSPGETWEGRQVIRVS